MTTFPLPARTIRPIPRFLVRCLRQGGFGVVICRLFASTSLHVDVIAVGSSGNELVGLFIHKDELLLCLIESTVGPLNFKDVAVLGQEVFSIEVTIVETFFIFERVELLGRGLLDDCHLSLKDAGAAADVGFESSRGACRSFDELADVGLICFIPISQDCEPHAFVLQRLLLGPDSEGLGILQGLGFGLLAVGFLSVQFAHNGGAGQVSLEADDFSKGHCGAGNVVSQFGLDSDNEAGCQIVETGGLKCCRSARGLGPSGHGHVSHSDPRFEGGDMF